MTLARRGLLAMAGAGMVGTAGTAGLAACAPLRPVGPASPSRWESRSGLVTPRDDFALALLGDRLFAIGGMTGARGNALRSMEVFSPRENRWAPGQPLPAGISSVRAATFAGAVHCVGGAREDREIAEVWAYAPTDDRWSRRAPLGIARMGHGLAAVGERLFAAGGLVGGEASDSVEVYDAARDAWSPGPPLPAPRFNLALVALGGKLYALGGSGTDRRPTATVSVYEPERDRWAASAALPQALSNFGAAALGDRLHALLHKLHYSWQPGESTWQTRPPMPTSRHGIGVAAYRGELYAVGGCLEDPQRDLSTVEMFRPQA